MEGKKEAHEKIKFAEGVNIRSKTRKGNPCTCGCDEYRHTGRGKYRCTGCGRVYPFSSAIKTSFNGSKPLK